MPRQARLDVPGTLHHVILRGLDRGAIVKDEADRAAFVSRLGAVAVATGTKLYAWALLPNHAHMLLRSGPAGLPRFMRRLLTGYAVTFNRRHHRTGHLFQNRYKSIVVEEDAYFRELVRYIHLNPLRAQIVSDLRGLARYAWCGHRALLRGDGPPWHDLSYVLAWFGRSERAAVQAYCTYLQEGIAQGRRPELVGGGLVRSLGGWAEVQAVRRRAASVLADPRILGTGAFVERLLTEGDARLQNQRARAIRLGEAEAVVRAECQRAGISAEELQMGGRRRRLSAVRSCLALRLVTHLGLSLAEAARHLGVSTSALARTMARAEEK
jgi:putative transposase